MEWYTLLMSDYTDPSDSRRNTVAGILIILLIGGTVWISWWLSRPILPNLSQADGWVINPPVPTSTEQIIDSPYYGK